MPTLPYTETTLDSKTRTGLSTQVLIYVNNEPVGAIQSFQITQNRPTKSVQEVGTDGIIEIVPSGATTYAISVNRVVFDGLSLPEAMSRSWVNIASQRIPFDIVIFDRFLGSEDQEVVVTTLHNCWFKSIGKQFQASDYVIAENASLECEFISSTRNGDAVAETQGQHDSRVIGSRQVDNSGAEQQADTGKTRGAMDFPGIIQAAYI